MVIARLKDSICNRAEKGVCCRNKTSASYLPHQDECGVNPAERSSFIVGGEEAEPGEFPFAALLGRDRARTKFIAGKRETFQEQRWHCGGTLVNRWYVLTA